MIIKKDDRFIDLQLLKRIEERKALIRQSFVGHRSDAKRFHGPNAQGLSQSMMTTYVSALIHACFRRYHFRRMNSSVYRMSNSGLQM